jgi:hypothetical protein
MLASSNLPWHLGGDVGGLLFGRGAASVALTKTDFTDDFSSSELEQSPF